MNMTAESLLIKKIILFQIIKMKIQFMIIEFLTTT